MLHILGQQESLANTLSNLAPATFSPWSDLVSRRKGNSVYREGVCIGRSPRDIGTGIPKVGGEGVRGVF